MYIIHVKKTRLFFEGFSFNLKLLHCTQSVNSASPEEIEIMEFSSN